MKLKHINIFTKLHLLLQLFVFSVLMPLFFAAFIVFFSKSTRGIGNEYFFVYAKFLEQPKFDQNTNEVTVLQVIESSIFWDRSDVLPSNIIMLNPPIGGNINETVRLRVKKDSSNTQITYKSLGFRLSFQEMILLHWRSIGVWYSCISAIIILLSFIRTRSFIKKTNSG